MIFTPASLAREWSCSERRIRSLARKHRACRIVGKKMFLTQDDVAALKDAMRAPQRPERKIIEEQAARIAQLEADATRRYRKDLEAQNENGFIYFIEGESGHVKIGFAKNVRKRVRQLQTAFPYPLTILAEMPGTREDEARLHKQFADSRMSGEWFHFSPALQRHVLDLTSK